ncbi:MAG: hypothetical protein CSA20_09040 [Deltaproteobacteria bacterium]|nr:MAG: hypothetical protein CSA20_09040 [Deltaproteobacteria bacterium]
MITYLYWGSIILVILFILWISAKIDKWKIGGIAACIVLVIGWGTYYFRLQQVFVKNYGGVMTIEVPPGMRHISATWKDTNLWVENYDPKTNACIFTEYSKGNILQGKVTIKNCNPLIPRKQNLAE